MEKSLILNTRKIQSARWRLYAREDCFRLADDAGVIAGITDNPGATLDLSLLSNLSELPTAAHTAVVNSQGTLAHFGLSPRPRSARTPPRDCISRGDFTHLHTGLLGQQQGETNA
jgi:hypothetical protein